MRPSVLNPTAAPLDRAYPEPPKPGLGKGGAGKPAKGNHWRADSAVKTDHGRRPRLRSYLDLVRG